MYYINRYRELYEKYNCISKVLCLIKDVIIKKLSIKEKKKYNQKLNSNLQ